MTHYTPEFKEQALLKVSQRGARTIAAVADELNLPFTTLKGWWQRSLRQSKRLVVGTGADWSPEQKLQALLESHVLSGPTLAAWCREKGLFESQLQQWRTEFCTAKPAPNKEAVQALRDLQGQHSQLQAELRRKDKALAEAAALLVLQKKFRALLEDEGK